MTGLLRQMLEIVTRLDAAAHGPAAHAAAGAPANDAGRA
jgi:hypothetical protein